MGTLEKPPKLLYLPLPNSLGHVSWPLAVVRVAVKYESGWRRLIPLAPDFYRETWSGGFYTVDSWLRVGKKYGPARFLSTTEYEKLLAKASDDATTKKIEPIEQVTVRLDNGRFAVLSFSGVMKVRGRLHDLYQTYPNVLEELIVTCYDPEHRMPRQARAILHGFGLVQRLVHGRVAINPLVRKIVLDGDKLSY